jgi:hypothetical protein
MTMGALFPILLILHLLGLMAGFGGGIGLSQVAPRLAGASEAELPLLLKLERIFTRISLIGLALLLITGPWMLWVRFGGGAGLPFWFTLKMIFVALAVVAVGTNQIAKRRFRSGNRGALKWILVTGPLTGVSIVLAVIFAVLTFQ